MDAFKVTLPCGFASGGRWHRSAWIRPLCGRDEAFLCDQADPLPASQKVTAILRRCLERLGPVSPVGRQEVRRLTIGDREALLLQLRRITFGSRISCLLKCPEADCRQKMDLDLDVEDLLQPPYPEPGEYHQASLDDGGLSYRVTFRLPTGQDQEEVAERALQSPRQAADLILQRCIESVCRQGDGEALAEAWPPSISRAIPEAMEGLDPQAETKLKLACPSCGHIFHSLFDAASYFFKEIAAQGSGFYREVHSLAFHYHWSEKDILALTRPKRRLYLGLLCDALDGRAN